MSISTACTTFSATASISNSETSCSNLNITISSISFTMGAFAGDVTQVPALGIFFSANTQFMSELDLSITYFINSGNSSTATVSIENPQITPLQSPPSPFSTQSNNTLSGTAIDENSLIIYQSAPVDSVYNYSIYLPVEPSTTVTNVQINITV